MRLHKNLSISDKKLKQLKDSNGEDVKQWIKDKKLFSGYPTKYAEAEEKKIYERINPRTSNKKSKKDKPSKATKRNSKDNKE